MQHYGVSDVRDCSIHRERHVDHILRKYPELLVSLNCVRSCDMTKLKCDRRLLRKDADRTRKHRRLKKVPTLRIKQFESALFDAMDDSRKVMLFNCPICRNVLKGPVTVECGHTFCKDCLDRTDSESCGLCATAISNTRCINVLVQGLVEKWRERNKSDLAESSIPNTTDILGIQPRYHLRSGFAGLQINEDHETISQQNDEDKSLAKTLFTKTDMSSRKFNSTIKSVFKEVESIQQKAIRCCWDSITPNDLECILCSRCIFDPITTACGHTFCKACLTRVLDHGLSCPLCMAPLSVKDYSRGSSVILDQAIKFLLPKEYNERLLTNMKEVHILNKNSDIPVFICTNAFPGVACPLYVYEPRYRLLVRRCLLSPTRRFAMAAKESTSEKFVSYGTVLEVKDAVSLEDGSFILTTVGVRRFKVLTKGEQDGYDTAKIQVIKDIVVSSDKVPELLNLHQKVYNKACKWIMSLTPKVLAEVERLIGQMPNVEKNWLTLPDGPSWTWWLMPILPLSSQLQVGFLSTTSLEKRLRAIDKMLERMEIRMKALERNTMNCLNSDDSTESCSDSERTFEIPINH
ncbi:LON peptidase N-terminal domain and RING finger protein 1 [Zophobas morio]|uniref:LON peptidase N-terminal domain and RING finger protein 1 n=1 Tax=Zophobas morio TaxID=2755281 RepID=UPI0030828980